MIEDTLEILVPLEGLRRYLDGRFGPSADEVTVSRLGEGHSNLTFLVRRGPDEWVLRRPPRGDILPGTHEMHREFTVMTALREGNTGVPVPRTVDLCRDERFIGAPFYLMEQVDGVVVRGAVPGFLDSPDGLRGMGESLADTLAQIHSVDWRGVGLESFARKPEQFLERNVRRMGELYEAVRHRDVPEIDKAGEWLRENRPEQRETTLTHGDYKLDNVILAPDAPARIAAVVDWEISAVGDPLVDLGWMLYFSAQAGDPEAGRVSGEVSRRPGYPTRADQAERYARATGRDLEHLIFYTAYAGWKIAIIMEGSNLRFKQGMADDPMFATLDEAVPLLAQRSLDFIEGRISV